MVDDEPMICRGIRSMLIRLDHPAVDRVDICFTGGDAIRFIEKEAPDLVIVDVRMPDISGLTVIETSRNAGSEAAFFVLSGHDEFMFVREAFKLGALDYLLKPATLDDLKSVIELTDARSLRGSGEREQHEEADRLRLELQIERALERGDNMTIASAFETAGLDPPYRHCRMSTIRLARSVGEARLAARKSVEPCIDQVQQSLNVSAHFFWTPESDLGILWNLKSKHDIEPIRGLLKDVLRELQQHTGPAVAAISLVVPIEASMVSLHRQMNATMLYRLQPGSGGVLVSEELEQYYGVPSGLDTSQAERAAQEGNFDTFLDFTERLFADSPATHGEALSAAYRRVMRAATLYCEQTGIVLSGVHSTLDDLDSMSAVRLQFRHIVSAIESARSVNAAPVAGQAIERALHYIETHLHEDIDMAHVAETVHMSYSHFSRVFKQQVGHGFNHYVHTVRMKHARRLLHDPGRRIIDVAHAVGYRNPKRFARVFKEHVNVTPDQYRRGYTSGA